MKIDIMQDNNETADNSQRICAPIIPNLQDVLLSVREEHLPTRDHATLRASRCYLSDFRATYFSISGKIIGSTSNESLMDYPFALQAQTEFSMIAETNDNNDLDTIYIVSPDTMLKVKLTAPDDELKGLFIGLTMKNLYIHDIRQIFLPLMKRLGPSILPRHIISINAAAVIFSYCLPNFPHTSDLPFLMKTYIKPDQVPDRLKQNFNSHEEKLIQQALLMPYLHREMMIQAKKLFGSTRPVDIENDFLPEILRIEVEGISVNAGTLEPKLPPLLERRDSLKKEIAECGDVKTAHRKKLESQLGKLISEITFLNGFLETRSGRVHATFNSYSCESGRVATRHPNVQGILRDYKNITYLAPPGKAIIAADIPASQLRIAAIVANDRRLIQAFQEGKDVHRETTAKLLGKSPEQVTDKERQIGKTAHFQLLFGAGANTFKEKLEMATRKKFTSENIQNFISGFREAYPDLAAWQSRIMAEADEIPFEESFIVRTLTGKQIRALTCNQALNYAIAGSEAEIFKVAVTRFSTECRKNGINAHIVNLVHDSIVVEADLEDIIRASELLKKSVESAMNEALGDIITEIDITTMAEAPVVPEAETGSENG